MPNPPYAHSAEQCLPLPDPNWRLHVRYTHATRYQARLQRFYEGSWRSTGPYFEGGSVSAVLKEVAVGYRHIADLLEQQYKFAGQREPGGGCPRCGYAHPYINARDHEISLHCMTCNYHTSRTCLEAR